MHRSFKQLALLSLGGRLMSGDAAESVRLEAAQLNEDLGKHDPVAINLRLPSSGLKGK